MEEKSGKRYNNLHTTIPCPFPHFHHILLTPLKTVAKGTVIKDNGTVPILPSFLFSCSLWNEFLKINGPLLLSKDLKVFWEVRPLHSESFLPLLGNITIGIILLVHGLWWSLSMTVLFTIVFFLAHVLLRRPYKADQVSQLANEHIKEGYCKITSENCLPICPTFGACLI